jgi:uncharacterized protein
MYEDRMKKFFLSSVILSTLLLALGGCDTLPRQHHSTSPTPTLPVMGTPKKVALLLPLSGPFANAGNSVKNGFTSAQTSLSGNNMHVQVYNTANGDIKAIYQQAMQEGAQFIVGPLSKPEVGALASVSPTIPVLALNYTSSSTPGRFYELGLSPLDEAKQIATRASSEGHRQAIVIAPAGDWGKQVVSTFTNQWQAQGGHISDTLMYQPGQALEPAIKQLLHAQKLPKNAGTGGLSRYRRQDMDMIFLAVTNPRTAEQIVPLLRFYYANNVPIYATSNIYGNSSIITNGAQDLDGLIFCDMPYVLNGQASQAQGDAKLYALGLDAYQVMIAIANNNFSANGISGATGFMQLSDRKIMRTLQWARMQNGQPVLVQ